MVPAVSPRHARSAAASGGGADRAAAFCSEVGCPFLVVGLVADGAPPSHVGVLLLGNAAALVVGHGYRAERPNRER
jgi:hypothetical protein